MRASSATSTAWPGAAPVCAATAKCETTGSNGISSPRAMPWATPQATRKPVNPPGPWPNATACSAPGPVRLGQQFAGHGQQPLGVLLGSFVLTDGDVQPAVGRAQQGDAAARRRGFQSQQV